MRRFWLAIIVACSLPLSGCGANHDDAEASKAVSNQEETVSPSASSDFSEDAAAGSSSGGGSANPAASFDNEITVVINGTSLKAELEDNSSAAAFAQLLADGPLTVDMHDYGNMEKVGDIGASLPANDRQTTTAPGDIILYQGDKVTIYYAPNTWNFTRLGHIAGIGDEELKGLLGPTDAQIVFSLG